MLVVGLTGGIGAGKTLVASLFAKHGIPIIDADVIARELTQPKQPALLAIVQHFKEQLLLTDGTLDRAKLRKIIFNDPKQRHWLESLLHPLIRDEMVQQIKQVKMSYCIAIIPLLFEVEFYSFINRILVVDATENLQIERVLKRDNISKTELDAILKTQANRLDRVARAQDLITNNGSLEALNEQVEKLHEKYLAMSRNDD